MGKGGGPVGAIFRGVKSVIGGVGKTIMGGLGIGKKKSKPAPSDPAAKDSLNTAAAALGMRQRQISYTGRTSTILGSPQGITEEANTSQARLG
jgi:hypothetical protein